MRITLALCTLLASAQMGHSLSCIKPNLGVAFNAAAQSEDRYLMVLGSVNPIEEISNPNDPNSAESMGIPFEYQAHLSGTQIGGRSDKQVSNLRVAVRISCLAHWCGFPPKTNKEVLSFLKIEGENSYSLSVSACPGAYFSDVSDAELTLLRRCMRAGSCSDQIIEKFYN